MSQCKFFPINFKKNFQARQSSSKYKVKPRRSVDAHKIESHIVERFLLSL